MAEVKKIPTFSWLCRKAAQLLSKDKGAYDALRKEGIADKMLKGVIVRMQLQDGGGANTFSIKSIAEGKLYCSISGNRFKGEFYTLYIPEFTTTQYRKRVHKYLPWSLPEGVKSEKYTPCVYFNADGTEACRGQWYGGRRNRSGRPDREWMVIRDRDGKFMDSHESGEDKGLGENWNWNNPTDLWQGFLPGSVMSKMDWYASMVPPEPLWDANKMRLLAAKVHSEAIKISKKYPHMKVALYPAATWAKVSNLFYADPLRINRFGGDARPPTVVGRDQDGEAIMWTLPELVLYWTTSIKGYHHDVHQPRWMRVVIPPAGSESLNQRGDSCLSRSYRDGPRANSVHYIREVTMGASSPESAYHNLACVQRQYWGAIDLNSHSRRRYHRYSLGQHPIDDKMHDWSDQSMVVVYDNWADEQEGYKYLDPYAAKPEGLFSRIEEKELIDSLPLC
jgi:hypothetical protein